MGRVEKLVCTGCSLLCEDIDVVFDDKVRLTIFLVCAMLDLKDLSI